MNTDQLDSIREFRFGSHVDIDCIAVAVENLFSLFRANIFYRHSRYYHVPGVNSMKNEEEKNSGQSPVDRRKFLQMAASTAAMVGSSTTAMSAQQTTPALADVAVNDTGALPPVRAGSDFMLDVIKSLGFEYVAANPGSSYRSLHESTINYGMNRNPELLTCLHEEAAVAIAHGYFKIEGKPMAVYAYSTVGLQHAAMAVYSAFCDRIPEIGRAWCRESVRIMCVCR